MIERLDVAVVGGGVAGLAVANRLREIAPDLRVIVLESGDRFGGKIQTEIVETAEGRFVVEAGPDAMLSAKPWAADLARRTGIGDHLVPINQLRPAVSICVDGQLRPLTAGIGQIGPTTVGGALRSPLLSPKGKIRALGDLVAGSGRFDADESVAAFARRRFGSEVVDRIVEPLAAGIYNADPERLSMAATMPRMRGLERKHRSMLLGMRRNPAKSGGPGFLTLRDGMQTLVDALVEANSSGLRTRASVRSLSQNSTGSYDIELATGSLVSAERVVLATPAEAATSLIQHIANDAATGLLGLRTADSAVISFGLPMGAIRSGGIGYGIVFPASEHQSVNAITISSRKFSARAPIGCELVRVFVGGHRSPASLDLDDQHLTDLALDSLETWLGVTSPPLFTRVQRWVASSPQYDVRHLERMAEIETALPVGMHVVGGAYRGIGIPDIIHDAEHIAELIVKSMGARIGERLTTEGVV